MSKLLSEWPNIDMVCGIDEVGRGCGAGPVVTAAVILPKGFNSSLIRDSKKLSEKQRNEAHELIIKNAISYSCNAGSVKDINDLGINKVTFNTMHRCLDGLTVKPNHILVDGITWDEYVGKNNAPMNLIPKGDDTYVCIAAASIVAKVRRDEYMKKLSELYPLYKFESNKGYLTADHIQALKENGGCKYHRTKFIRNLI